MVLSELEQKYVKYTDLIEPMHSKIVEGKEIENYLDFKFDLIHYTRCIVADIRKELRLGRDYRYECEICKKIAENFNNIENHNSVKGYEFILQQFPKHLEKDHGVSF